MDAEKNELSSKIKSITIESVKWTYLQAFLPYILTTVTTVALARLLAPSDFGLIAIATTTLSLLQIFQDMGLSKALIQSNEDEMEVFNVVFWINIALSATLYTCLYFGAPLIAAYFSSADAVPIIRVLGLRLIFDALGAVQRNALIRNLRFKQIFFLSVLPALVPLFVTIPLAYFAYGVWSLVMGDIVSRFLSTMLLWTHVSWRPACSFNLHIARRTMVFGLWTTLEALVGWFYVQGDNAIVGRYFTSSEFGIYVMSYNIISIIIGTLLAPITAIAYTVFCRIQIHKELLANTLLDMMRLSALSALPLGVGMSFIANPSISLLLGKKWLGMETVFSVLAIAQGLAWVVSVNPEIYKAIGRPDIVSKFQVAKLLYTLPAYLIAAQFSLTIFVYTRLAVVILGLCLWFLLTVKTLSISFHDLMIFLRIPFMATAGMVLALVALKQVLTFLGADGRLMGVSILVMTGAISYMGLIYLLDQNLVRRVFHLILYTLGRHFEASPLDSKT